MQSGPLKPACLSPGTQVGPWRIVDLRGSGTYGVVYLAGREAPGGTGDVALKLALHPQDERFEREAELLSRIHHPCVPRLLDRGQWQSPWGLPHPYIAMEWVQGVTLYEWARVRVPSSRQVLGLLASLARALEATHPAGAVHRDVKGDNVLARLKDGRVFLVDFGSSKYRGAATLTEGVFPPGTPEYRSPEAYQFALNILRSPVKTYAPEPADDLFALGVTGYRLVTGRYPPMRADPQDAESHVWNPDGPGPRPARELNACCCPELSALISRMLAIRPEPRGSARELAEALEQAAREAGPEADAPLFRKTPRPVEAEAASQRIPWDALQPEETGLVPRDIHWEAPPSVEAERTSQLLTSRAPRGNWLHWLAVGLTGPAALGVAWVLSTSTSGREETGRELVAEQEEARDAGTVAAGDSALTAPVGSIRESFSWSPIALDLPSKPFPRQLRPDARGRCPRTRQVPINGGCWIETKGDPKDCTESESSYVYKGACYLPAYPPELPATSRPTESRDGG